MKISEFQPLHNKVLIERFAADEVTAGGIIIPGSNQEKPLTGKVLAVGDGRNAENGERVTMSVSVGDEVMFSKYSVTEIKLEEKDLLIVKECDILGKKS